MLANIAVKVFHVTRDRVVQAKKVLEEAGELLEAVVAFQHKPTKENEDNVIEEALDVVQATFNLIDLYQARNDVAEHYARIVEKNERRGYFNG